MTIRPANAGDAAPIARVHVDCWRTTYQGIVSDKVLNELSVADRQNRWIRILNDAYERVIVFVLETDKQEVVGFASAGAERGDIEGYDGELYAIYILEDWQGKGGGRQLLQAVARDLHKKGLKSLAVWVLKENPFAAFYQNLGGQYVREKPIDIGSDTLIEHAYGWPDIRVLIEDKEQA
jgi:L-amino acid N-acyltransferase YncA